MTQSNFTRISSRVAVLCLSLSMLAQPFSASAQGESVEELRRQSTELVKRQAYAEALPILEKLAKAAPDDAQTQFYLGFALIAQANTSKDAASRKSSRIRARNAFIKSKQLGSTEPVVDALIQSIPADGSDPNAFSQNGDASKLMVEAEALFSHGKLDDALKNYQKALGLDPTLYEAALFSGDVYAHNGDFLAAEIWYQKAIAINPTREIAYRYSATPLMKQGRFDEARDRYVEGYITEPYSRFATAGLTQWAKATNAKMAHPTIDIPTKIYLEGKDKDDGSMAWIMYGVVRSSWRKEEFARKFPAEKSYRRSLAEESNALRSVVATAVTDKNVKTLSPSLAKLKKLMDDGLLEAYILMARADDGIAADHPSYLKAHRDKLRRYVVEYVLTGGGK